MLATIKGIEKMTKNIVIVGGVAGGMATATRLRRLCDKCNITVIEKGEYVSFANCGMPYYIGDVITDRSKLIVKTPEQISKLFNITIKTQTEAVKIDREKKLLMVKNAKNGTLEELSYDTLVLSTGAKPFIPPTPGMDHDQILSLRNINDMDKIKKAVDSRQPKSAVVIGGGFIGLEMVENLKHRGIDVSLIELDQQVMAPLDPEMASFVHQTLVVQGVKLYFKTLVEKVESLQDDRFKLYLKNGDILETDLVILSIGVKPDTSLAKEAGLELGLKDAIVVDEKLQTSDPSIVAVGDAVQVKNYIDGTPTLIPLAGPANRQARVIAENMMGYNRKYKGTLGTAICKVFDLDVATTGLNEKTLGKSDKKYMKIYVNGNSHASYYPEADSMIMKILFEPDSRKILGAQIVGGKGTDKRIDVLSTAIQTGMLIDDLGELELSYAPHCNSVKDPLNIAGHIASNVKNGLVDYLCPDQLETLQKDKTVVIDVSTPEEHEVSEIPGSINIPVDQIRSSLKDLDESKEYIVYCGKGIRSYFAYRFLAQNGFKVKTLSGGYTLYKAFQQITDEDYFKALQEKAGCACTSFCSQTNEEQVMSIQQAQEPSSYDVELNACGLQCPGPILRLKEEMDKATPGTVVKVLSSDSGFAVDVIGWANNTGNSVISVTKSDKNVVAYVKKGTETNALPAATGGVRQKGKTLVLFSNDLDKALAAFIIANGAASMGEPVTIFFTFWGLNVLRKDVHQPVKKGLLDHMFGMMMPKGPNKLALSKMHMMGMGTSMMKYVMKEKNVLSLPELMETAKKSGIRLVACTMSMDVMGIQKEELIDGIEEAGVAGFLDSANKSSAALFI